VIQSAGVTPVIEHLLTPKQAADVLGVKLNTLRTWASRRQVPVQRVNGALRFSPAALREWLASQARPAADPLGDDESRTRQPGGTRRTCVECSRVLLQRDRAGGHCGPGRGCAVDEEEGGPSDAA